MCFPSAKWGRKKIKAPLRGGEALRAIRARKKSARQRKKRVPTGFEPVFLPPAGCLKYLFALFLAGPDGGPSLEPSNVFVS